jgi:hypothetical protein
MTRQPLPDPGAIEYKKRVQDSIERMELEYDKALLTLNPAAITVSIAMYNQLIAVTKGVPRETALLHLAWLCWLSGTICTLLSFLLSKMALQKALAKYEEGQLEFFGCHGSTLLAWAICTTFSATLKVKKRSSFYLKILPFRPCPNPL